MTDRLFDPGPAGETYSQRLTLRARDAIAAGRHPANGLPILTTGQTCGNCAHLQHLGYRSRTYLKCEHHRYGTSHSEASDMRAKWPACPHFQPRDED